VLPETGALGNVTAAILPFAVYINNDNFKQGAVDQVAYTYRKLGGDVLDIELTEENVYASYEEAVLEYSYLINIHQGKNSLSDILGAATASFDENGQMPSGHSLSGSNVELKYPKFQFEYAKKIADGMSEEAKVGGDKTHHSASVATVLGQQDYDLQELVYSASLDSDNSDESYYQKVGNRKVKITRVYYKTPQAMWRFYGYYGGLNTVGNLQNYGQYSDDSTFQVVPVWQNKAQAHAFEDAIYTRNSHYSYEIKNNKLRLYPPHTAVGPTKIWFEFIIPDLAQPWEDADEQSATNVGGVNNINTAPFTNIPYENINSIGKQWIRRYAFALTKEILGMVRSKFSTIPIPGESVTLNGPELISQAKEDQNALREELKTVLDELTYNKLVAQDAEQIEAANKIMAEVPLPIFVG